MPTVEATKPLTASRRIDFVSGRLRFERNGSRRRDLRPLLRRARYAPCRDGGVLRARVVRAAHLPGALDPRLPRPGRLVERARLVPRGRVPGPVGRVDRPGRRCRPAERCDALHRRRRRAPLELAVALLVARVGVQHRVRPAEPAVPAREAPRDRLHDHRAARPVRRADGRERSGTTCCAGTRRTSSRTSGSRSP